MTTRIAIGIFLILGCLVAVDLTFDWGGTLFAARKGIDLIGIIAFWR